MDTFKSDYVHQLSLKAEENMKSNFRLPKPDFSAFQIINASLLNHLFSEEGINLLISIPTNELPKNVLEISILLSVLQCFLQNVSAIKAVNVGDIIIKTGCGTVSRIKTIGENHIQVLPVLWYSAMLGQKSYFFKIEYKYKTREIL